jgi:hypothetical protein
MNNQCKLPIKFEDEKGHTLFCIKDKDHDGLHEFWKMPLSMQISLTIKEWLWYRWVK